MKRFIFFIPLLTIFLLAMPTLDGQSLISPVKATDNVIDNTISNSGTIPQIPSLIVRDITPVSVSYVPSPSSEVVETENSSIQSVNTAEVSVTDPWVNLPKFLGPLVIKIPLSDDPCPAYLTGITNPAPSRLSHGGVKGTTSEDIATFAAQYNAIRRDNCLASVPVANFRYDSCMEDRLFWMAESPSPDPLDAWGHIGSVRIDGVPSVGCDGNLAGGTSNTGATVATKWWNSLSHRASLYRPATYTGSMNNICIMFAMTHGGIDEPDNFVRAAARWKTC